MRSAVVIVALLGGACATKEPASPVREASGSARPPTAREASLPPSEPQAPVARAHDPAPAARGDTAADFSLVAQALVAVAACGGSNTAVPEGFPVARIQRHCAAVHKTRDEYARRWVAPARDFFVTLVPAEVPKKVVYPFAGGDLSTALTVYPDADEITTLSLEPAGDPRTLDALRSNKPGLDRALATIAAELRFLYTVNFSNTMNMIEAMRGGQLPTQLVFGLSALHLHGYEVVALRYFTLGADGAIVYLTDEDVAKAPPPGKGSADARNRIFANAELRFRKPGGREQLYRHLQANLDNPHLAKDPRVLRHLEAKGSIAAMTKAASYLLSWDEFSTIRQYLIDHVVWMVSDATGVPPKYGTPAGFTYQTWGAFQAAHIDAGKAIAKDWREQFARQDKRSLKFRFGYYDGSDGHTNHLIVMRKAAQPRP